MSLNYGALWVCLLVSLWTNYRFLAWHRLQAERQTLLTEQVLEIRGDLCKLSYYSGKAFGAIDRVAGWFDRMDAERRGGRAG